MEGHTLSEFSWAQAACMGYLIEEEVIFLLIVFLAHHTACLKMTEKKKKKMAHENTYHNQKRILSGKCETERFFKEQLKVLSWYLLLSFSFTYAHIPF